MWPAASQNDLYGSKRNSSACPAEPLLRGLSMTDLDRFVAEGVRAARRVIIGVLGLTVLVAGLALLVLPGPAFVVIPIGLAILAVEFEWARRLLRRARRFYENAAQPPDSASDSSQKCDSSSRL